MFSINSENKRVVKSINYGCNNMPWQLEINTDNTQVLLNLKRLTPQDHLNSETIISALQDKNIPINPDIENHITMIINQLDKLPNHDHCPVLIQAVEVKHGIDGYFEWAQKCDPEKAKPSEDESKIPDRTSFYNQSRLKIVNQGDQIGVLHPAAEGEPGENVFGQTITPQPGTDFNVDPGANVELAADGQTFIAKCDGQPKLENHTLCLDSALNINTDVDFGTGNVSFSGEVNIRGDIKDMFQVKTGGNLNVEGTIEAAHIECGGSLTVKRGVTGKEKGQLQVHKNLSAKYLSNVTVWVKGDAAIDSEIVNTDLNCRGKVILQRGAIHGGQVCAAGNIQAPIIGSNAAVRTIIQAGVDPYLKKQIEESQHVISEYSDRINILMPQARALLAASRGRPNQELKKLADQIQTCKMNIEQAEEKKQRLLQEMAQKCNGVIVVHKLIYPGVILCVGNSMKMVEKETPGPLEVVISRLEGDQGALDFRAPSESPAK
jgi:uncharacterized protein (DUF342 family)